MVASRVQNFQIANPVNGAGCSEGKTHLRGGCGFRIRYPIGEITLRKR